jgi:O-antigen/teichoic acid export membrane protein
MKEFYNLFSKSFLIYGFGTFLSKFLILIIIPYLTFVFSPSEFAIIELLTICITFVIILSNIGLGDSVSYFYFKFDKNLQKQRALIFISFVLRIFSSLILFPIFILFIPILKNILNYTFFDYEIYIIVFFVGVLNGFFNHSVNIFLIKFYQFKYIFFDVLKSLLVLLFLVNFVNYYNLDIKSYFYAYFYTFIILNILIFFIIKKELFFKKNIFSISKKLIFYGSPIVLTQLGFFFMSIADRIFINELLDKSSLGVYAIAGKFAIIVSFFIEVFNRTWGPFLMKEINNANRKISNNIFIITSRVYVSTTSILIILISLISEFLIVNTTENSYHEAYKLIPLLSWYFVFFGFFNIISSNMWKENKTIYTSIAISISLIINIMLNIVLIPKFGLNGAAYSTIISFVILLIVSLKISQKIHKIEYPYLILFLKYFISFVLSYIVINDFFVNSFINLFLSILAILFIIFISINKSIKKNLFKLIGIKI